MSFHPTPIERLPGMRIEPCVCGGCIQAESTEFAAVAVQLHNASATHLIWRAIREGRFSAEGNTTVASRDLSGLSGDTSSPLLRVGYQERRTH